MALQTASCCARDGRLSTTQVMRHWRQKMTRTVIPVHPCIFCGGPEEDTGHMRALCAWDEVVARLLCERVDEFTAEPPLGGESDGILGPERTRLQGRSP